MKTFTSQCNYKGRIVGLLIFCLLCAFMPAQAQDDSRYVSGVVMNRLTRAAVMGTVVEAYTMDGKKICSDKVSGSRNNGVLIPLIRSLCLMGLTAFAICTRIMNLRNWKSRSNIVKGKVVSKCPLSN